MKSGHISYSTRPAAVAGTDSDSVAGLSAGGALRQLYEQSSAGLIVAPIAQAVVVEDPACGASLLARREDGNLEIMLVTSRGTRRWIIPERLAEARACALT